MAGEAVAKKMIIIILCLIGILLIVIGVRKNTAESLEQPKRSEAPLEVVALQVGKADSLLLLTKNSTVVIDTGEEDDGAAIVDYLANKGRNSIDCLIITHFDKDHVGGADTIIAEMDIQQIYQTNTKKKSVDYEEYKKETVGAKERVSIVSEITEFSLDGVTYCIFPPADKYDKKKSNNSSLIVSASYGEHKFLFMGDAMEERVAEYLEYESKTYDVVKVPYHGRYLENTELFLDATMPKYAIVTSSKEDMEDIRTIQELEKRNAKILLTREGTITIGSDGKELYLITE